MIDLSIIILNYNTREFLVKCLQSIKVADLSGMSVEVIVVDNASTDGSGRAVKNFHREATSSAYFPISNFQLISNERNLGFAKGNNVGVKKSHGKYVLFLNPDTVLSKNVLKVMFEFMEKHPDVGVASPKLVLANGGLDEASHRGFPTPWNAFSHFSGLRSLFPTSKVFAGYTQGWLLDNKEPHEVDSVSGAFLFTRHKVGEEIGWWDEDYFWYGEDLDFCYKVKDKGWKIMFLPQVSVLHYRGVASGIKGHSKEISTSTPETKMRAALASTEAMRIFYKKHYMDKYPRVVTWLVLFAISVLEKTRAAKV